MDWAKVDAPLAAALADAAPDELLDVFVEADPTAGSGEVRTARLPAADVAALTEQEHVRRIRLSNRMRLLDDG